MGAYNPNGDPMGSYNPNDPNPPPPVYYQDPNQQPPQPSTSTNSVAVVGTSAVQVSATASNDVYTGDAANNTFEVLAGTAGGLDSFDGGDGTDQLTFYKGEMRVQNVETVVMSGADGKELVLLAPGTVAVTLSAGNDAIMDPQHTITGVTLNLTGNLAAGDMINLGASGNTVNLADGGNNAMLNNVQAVNGGSGADTINLLSAGGTTTITGGGGNDILNIGSSMARDTLVFSGSSGVDQINGFTAGASGDVLKDLGFSMTAASALGVVGDSSSALATTINTNTNKVTVFVSNNAISEASLKGYMDAGSWDATNTGNQLVVWLGGSGGSATKIGVGIANNDDTANNNDVSITVLAEINYQDAGQALSAIQAFHTDNFQHA